RNGIFRPSKRARRALRVWAIIASRVDTHLSAEGFAGGSLLQTPLSGSLSAGPEDFRKGIALERTHRRTPFTAELRIAPLRGSEIEDRQNAWFRSAHEAPMIPGPVGAVVFFIYHLPGSWRRRSA